MLASSSSSARSRLSLWVFAVLAVAACGGDDSPSDGERDSGRDAARADGSVGIDGAALDGTVPDDGAIPTLDTGPGPSDDGGTAGEGGTTDDGGTPADDGATPADGGGTPTDDGGTPTDDGGTPTDDGGTPTDDAGPPPGDSGPGIDLGPAPDAGTTPDTGPRDAGSGGCFTNADCPRRGEFCETASCGGPGICLATPETCTGIDDPVCGCDGVTYGNDCLRQRAGVGRASRGACPGTCDLRPPADSCCYENADCDGRASNCALAVGEPMCSVGGEGICKAVPAAGRCWDDDNCDATAGEVCEGARICPCGALCALADEPGRCQEPSCSTDPTTAGCCFVDANCALGTSCYGAVCSTTTQGRCLPPPPDRLHCWDDSDCAFFPGGGRGICDGEFICGCGMSCGGRADSPGNCLFALP